MATLQNMPERIRDYIQENELVRPAIIANEPAVGVQLALARITDLVASTFAELAGLASGREVLWNMAREANDTETAASAQKGDAMTAQRGAEMVKSVLDDRYHGTVHAVAIAAGVQTASVVRLIEVVSAAALEVTGKLLAEHHWNAQQLGEWLRKQHAATASSTGLGVAAPMSGPASLTAAPITGGPAAWFARYSSPLLVAVGLVVAGEFGYLLGKRNTDGNAVSTAQTEQSSTGANRYDAMPVANLSPSTSSSAARVGTARPQAAVPVVLKLKNGLRQVIGANSTESKLYQFLIDPAKEVDLVDPTKGWIGFDRIYFDSNKATLTNESLWQLSNVASILKRFPASKIKLGGYTDSTGSPLRNLKLSQERAKAAKAALVSLGVADDRLTAVGYGALDNLASNDTEEGRSINRRVSMQVVLK